MPRLEIVSSVPVVRSARVLQLEGLFDVPPAERSEQRWAVDLPLDDRPWQLGLVVGPSGSGKSTLARQAFGDALIAGYDWPADRSIVDGFPTELGIKDVTGLLSSVGFSTPPAWLRPFRCLSNGEQFRVTLARALADPRPLVAVDEFTSVVDRTVAQIGSAAVAKAVRRMPGKRFVAVTCHHDVEEWLTPDWVCEMPAGAFNWRSLRRRPPIGLEVVRCDKAAWKLFQHHHYLDTSLAVNAWCFAALYGGRPVAFTAVLHNPGRLSFYREHRTVCLPDFQGVGIGNALSEFVASLYVCRGKRYHSTTANPAMIRHRAKSPLWTMVRGPAMAGFGRDKGSLAASLGKSRASTRLMAGFRYVGPPRPADARRLGVI